MNKKPEDEDHTVSEDDANGTTRTEVYVTELGPCDVLLGRGTGPSMNEGNVSFRHTVEDLKRAYVSTPSRKIKKSIVRKAVSNIKAKDGRFLTKLKKGEAKILGLKGKVVFEVVRDSVAIEKTKQAIRYVHYKKDPSQVKRIPASQKRSNATGMATPTMRGSIQSTFSGVSGMAGSRGVDDHSTAAISMLSSHPLDPSKGDSPIRSSSVQLSTDSISGGNQKTPLQQGNIFPTPLNPALDGVLFNHRLNDMLPNGAGLGRAVGANNHLSGIMPPIPQSLHQAIPRSFFQNLDLRGDTSTGASTPGNFVFPFLSGCNGSSQLVGCGQSSSVVPTQTENGTGAASQQQRMSYDDQGKMYDGHLLALILADDEHRRLIGTYLSSLSSL